MGGFEFGVKPSGPEGSNPTCRMRREEKGGWMVHRPPTVSTMLGPSRDFGGVFAFFPATMPA